MTFFPDRSVSLWARWLAAISFSLMFAAPAAQAADVQAWPSKTIRIVVPFPPGGSVDNTARQLAPKLQAALGQTVIIDNRSGAGGTVGAAEVARAVPDGHTLLMVFDSFATYPLVYPKLSFDVEKDLIPVTRIVSNPMVVVVHPSVPAKTIGEFVTLLKDQPDRYNFASVGPGSSNHLTGELFKAVSGTSITHVPYRGGGPAQQDLLGGQVEVMFLSASLALPHVKAAKLRPLAQTAAVRSPEFPDTPTLAESGFAGFDVDSWNGLMAPAGTPRAVIDRLQAEIQKIVNEPAFAARLIEQGLTPVASTPEDFATRIQADRQKWTRLVRDRSLSLE